MFWQAGEIGRADRFMRFLRILGFHRIFARPLRDITGTELLADDIAGASDRLRRELSAAGAQLSDETHRLAADFGTFIKSLGELHGPRGRKTELAARFLLEGRGRARPRRTA